MPSRSSGGKWIVEYQASMPATECSGASNSVIEPSRAGMARPSVGDELRDHVDAGPVDAQGMQVGGPVTRPAAEVEHGAGDAG